MPVRQIQTGISPQATRLRALLEQEWRSPNPEAEEPLILEEAGNRYTQSIHLYVIWSEWEPLSQAERSEVIMRAYEATHSLDDVLRVTVAMGLTRLEAARMGIEYENL